MKNAVSRARGVPRRACCVIATAPTNKEHILRAAALHFFRSVLETAWRPGERRHHVPPSARHQQQDAAAPRHRKSNYHTITSRPTNRALFSRPRNPRTGLLSKLHRDQCSTPTSDQKRPDEIVSSVAANPEKAPTISIIFTRPTTFPRRAQALICLAHQPELPPPTTSASNDQNKTCPERRSSNPKGRAWERRITRSESDAARQQQTPGT